MVSSHRVKQEAFSLPQLYDNQRVGFSWVFFLFCLDQVRDRIQHERDAGVSKTLTVPFSGEKPVAADDHFGQSGSCPGFPWLVLELGPCVSSAGRATTSVCLPQ